VAASIDSDEIHGINITPLVDIVLVLLIIFMVSTSVVMKQTIEVDVPKPARGETAEPPLMVTLDSHGALFVDGVALNREQAVLKLRESWKQNHDVHAVIRADTTLGYGNVVELIDLVRGAGITHFMMAK
jgi:biopolymer transport protein ExbD